MAVKEIQKKNEPTINLKEIRIADIETKDGKGKNEAKIADGMTLTKLYGTKFPIVEIGGKIWEPERIFYLDIYSNEADILPRINLRVAVDSYWEEKKMGSSREVISIFLDSRKDGLKPLRNDYLVTYSNLQNGYLELSGTLDVPSWTNEVNQAEKGTSLEVLEKISKDHTLGWATNIEKTDDEMNWIQANKGLNSYVTDIITGAYKDDTTFFDAWVDIYYIMNYIDISNTFEDKVDLDSAWTDSIMINPGGTNVSKDNDNVIPGDDGKLLLTNLSFYNGTNSFISKFQEFNNAGYVEQTEGEKRNSIFYDLQNDRKWDLEIVSDTFVENINGPKNKKKWMGILDTDNMHKNYIWSKAYSKKMKREIKKKYLEVTLNTINWNIYRGLRVPILIGRASLSSQNASEFEVNSKLTGWYTVSGISFHFEWGKLTQKLTLLRKDWPKSVNETT